MKLQKRIGTVSLILGMACVVYFVGLVSYAGLYNKFNYAWLVFGIFFGALGAALRFGKFKVSKKTAKFAAVIGGILLIVFLNIEGLVVSGFFQKGEENLDYIIVLGAKMNHGGPSVVLRQRLDKAIDYLEQNPDTIVIVSGGQGADEPVSEAQGMRDYLVAHGVDETRIIMENQSTTTKENLNFSAEYINIEEDRVGIVTNNFHVYRSVKLAKLEGYKNVYGIAAGSQVLMLPANMLREFACILYYELTGVM